MDDTPHIAWLYGQLAGLVEDGTLTADAAERLQRRYGDVETGRGGRRAIALFGLLGATLIGGGVILLLAHNWDDLSRPMRAFLSLLPLLAGQGLCLWTLLRRADSAAWREGAGAFLTMAIGASIALVSQTYHTGGAFEDFMLLWVLLALPVAYLMRATLPAVLYLAGIVIWAGSVSPTAVLPLQREFGYWILLALVLPWWLPHLGADRYRSRAALFGWALAITAPIGYALTAPNVFDAAKSWWPLFASIPATVLFLAGMRWWREAPTPAQGPFQTVGGLASVALALALSFSDVWRPTQASDLADAAMAPGAIVVFGWIAVAALLWGDALRRGDLVASLIGALPAMAAIGCGLASQTSIGAMLLFNIYLLAIGVALLTVGLRAQRLGVVNAGMLVLSALILARFFDADIGFVARGLGFIAVGAGFLVANLVLLRKMGAAK